MASFSPSSSSAVAAVLTGISANTTRSATTCSILPFLPSISTTSSTSTRSATAAAAAAAANKAKSFIPITLSSILQVHVPPPSQIIFASSVSFALAEIFNYLGLFQDENGLRAKERADRFFREHSHNNNGSVEIESALSSLLIGVEDWIGAKIANIANICNVNEGGIGMFHFHLPTIAEKLKNFQWNDTARTCSTTIQGMAFKHQFAIGTTAGMILHGASVLIAKAAVITYILSEMSFNIISNSEKAAKENVNNDNGNDNYHYPHGITGITFNGERDYIDAEMIFEILRDVRIFVFKCLKYVNRKLHWFRVRVRSILSFPQESLRDFFNGEWLDRDGTIVVGFVFGVLLGHLLS